MRKSTILAHRLNLSPLRRKVWAAEICFAHYAHVRNTTVVIEVTKALPGMLLSEDIIMPDGTSLVNSPTVLTDQIIQVLSKRGITKIQVDPTSMDAVSALADLPEELPEEGSVAAEQSGGDVSKADSDAPLPKISVIVSKDGMSADLVVEPGDNPDETFTEKDLLAALAVEGIVFGIKQGLLKDLVQKWHNVKRLYEVHGIAIGEASEPGREGEIIFDVKYIGNPQQLLIVQKVKYCSELASTNVPVQRVDPGTQIAHRQLSTPPVPGKDVRGEVIPCDEVIRCEVELDNKVEYDSEEETFSARHTGLVYYVKGKLGIQMVNFDGGAELEVTSDKMRAELTIIPPAEGGQPPSDGLIAELMSENKVVYGVKDDVLNETYANMSDGVFPEEPVLVAEGTPPVDGEDGKVDFLFSTESSLKPKENSDGSVDYKNVNLVHSVTEGAPLARLIPEGTGTPGTDVLGRELPCKDGTPAKLPKGPNTEISEDDEDLLVAAIDGNVRYNGSVIDVSEGYIISGDVDYSSGNVKYEKSVIVTGDIKSGFNVECGGDLQVGGTIEDAVIKTGGSVLSKFGFIGQGKGFIDAKGDVNITFAKNQIIRSGSDITIAKEALNCRMFSRKTITVSGAPLSVAGGYVLAREWVQVKTVGNMSGVRTILEVGADFSLMEELQRTDSVLTETTENRRKLYETAQKYDRIQKMRKKLSAKDEFLFSKLKNTLGQYDQQIKSLENRKKLIQQKMYDFDRAFVKFEHSAMPGTIFKFGERQFLVRDELVGPKTVRLIRGEIRIL